MELVETYVRGVLHDVCGYLVMPGDVVRFRYHNGAEEYYATGEYVAYHEDTGILEIKWHSKQLHRHHTENYYDPVRTLFDTRRASNFSILTRFDEVYRGLFTWS